MESAQPNWRRICFVCWPYGRIDCQFAKGGADGYVSKYINGTSRLSAIQRLSSFKPFSQLKPIILI